MSEEISRRKGFYTRNICASYNDYDFFQQGYRLAETQQLLLQSCLSVKRNIAVTSVTTDNLQSYAV